MTTTTTTATPHTHTHAMSVASASSATSVGAISLGYWRARCASQPVQHSGNDDARPLGSLKLVFVACCHSHRVGELFLAAGAQYVVCVKRKDKVMDKAGAVFARAFYYALLTGQTISEAFEVGQVRRDARVGCMGCLGVCM